MEYFLTLRSVEKRFPGVHALKSVDFELSKGECVALLGENGAGKSTLIKILGGAQSPDGGRIELDGKKVVFEHPTDSLDAGIAIIYQEFNLVPGLSAGENMFLGMEPNDYGWVRRGDETKKARGIFKRIGSTIDPNTRCDDLTVAEKQMVEIAKALARNARILIMDEPSAALTNKEVERLYELVDDLKAQGLGIVYVSHRLEEVERLADRAVVLRDGARVGELLRDEMRRDRIIELMVGRPMDSEFPQNDRKVGAVRLRACNLKRGKKVKNISLDVHAGEILALTGLVGAGRTETVRLLFGADVRDGGIVELDGEVLNIKNPQDAINAGICLLTEDRKEQGLVLGLSVKENFGLPNLRSFSKSGLIDRNQELSRFDHYVESISIKISGPDQLAEKLSGGNQQKVVLAKWLEKNAEILIFDEPTRGIDVGAKFEIYQWMNCLANQGKGIIMISSELPEVLGMSDRIMVLKEGGFMGEVTNGPDVTQEKLMAMAIGIVDEKQSVNENS
jgi:ABC-type sugar transport system ATPase subunit